MTSCGSCSYFVLIESSGPKRRFPPPGKLERPNADTFMVSDANNIPLAIVPYRDDLKNVPFYHRSLTSDEARRIAKAITRLPEFFNAATRLPSAREW